MKEFEDGKLKAILKQAQTILGRYKNQEKEWAGERKDMLGYINYLLKVIQEKVGNDFEVREPNFDLNFI